MALEGGVQQGWNLVYSKAYKKHLAAPHRWQEGNVLWQMGKYCLQWSGSFYAEMQVAMVSLEIASKTFS